jgi:hypothetical protein
MLITGIQMMVPLVGLLIFLVISCRTISTPLFHHEFLLKKRQGPSILERRTIMEFSVLQCYVI